MSRISTRFAAALLTFVIGVVAATVYFVNRIPSAVKIERQSPYTCFPGLSIEIDAVDSKDVSYFPSGIFDVNAQQNQFTVNWYSKHLVAMNEPPLMSSLSKDSERYRFLWLRSFHRPVAVRLWRSGDETFLTVKQLDGAGGYEPGKLITNETRAITEEEREVFSQFLEQSCYWKLPTEDSGLAGADGAQWILEGVKEGRYHIVDRWSPKSGNYREACLYLLKLAGIEADPIY